MATVLPAPERAVPDVRAAIDGARETLVRLGAIPFLARLDAASAAEGTAPAPGGSGGTHAEQEVVPSTG